MVRSREPNVMSYSNNQSCMSTRVCVNKPRVGTLLCADHSWGDSSGGGVVLWLHSCLVAGHSTSLCHRCAQVIFTQPPPRALAVTACPRRCDAVHACTFVHREMRMRPHATPLLNNMHALVSPRGAAASLQEPCAHPPGMFLTLFDVILSLSLRAGGALAPPGAVLRKRCQ